MTDGGRHVEQGVVVGDQRRDSVLQRLGLLVAAVESFRGSPGAGPHPQWPDQPPQACSFCCGTATCLAVVLVEASECAKATSTYIQSSAWCGLGKSLS